MPFSSLAQICGEFGISETAPDEMRRELKRRLKKLHPDAAPGGCVSGAAAPEVLRLTEALHFLDNAKRQTALVPVEEVTALVQAIKDLVPCSREKEAGEKLSQLIDDRAEELKASGRFMRRLLTGAAGLLSLVWLFPAITGAHPVLRTYVHVDDTLFNVIWFSLLLYTAATWFVYKLWRQRDIDALKSLKLAHVQNRLFRQFVLSKAAGPAGAGGPSFFRDELVSFLEGARERRSSGPAAGTEKKHIDAELAQMMGDILISRGEARGVIRKSDRQSLRDLYDVLIHPGDL